VESVLSVESGFSSAAVFSKAMKGYFGHSPRFCHGAATANPHISLGTKWGLIRYYWVLAKLLINSLAIPILLLHTRIISEVANAAAKGNLSPAELRGPRVQLVVVAVAAVLALLAASALSVYKPRGITPFNISRRKIVD
jgi:hypothetical protein